MNSWEVHQGPETTPVGIYFFTTWYSALYNTDKSWKLTEYPTHQLMVVNEKVFSNQKWQHMAVILQSFLLTNYQ